MKKILFGILLTSIIPLESFAKKPRDPSVVIAEGACSLLCTSNNDCIQGEKCVPFDTSGCCRPDDYRQRPESLKLRK